jgi:glycosyltransferase involved in cell wall biosynthesis
VFAHFSGVVPDAPEVYSKHQNRFRAADTGGLAGLLAHYQQRLLANGWRETSRLPYAWSRSPSGRRIVDAMRLHYREVFPRPPTPGELSEAGFEGCLPEWMDQPGSEHRVEAPLTRLVWRCWQMRDDLRSAFDIRSADGRRAMLEWFTHCGTPDFGADAESIAAAHRAQNTPHNTAPEPRLAWPRQRGIGPAASHRGAEAFFAEVIAAAFPEGTLGIPRQLALLWEARQDLQTAFPMHTAGHLTEYLVWSLSSGLAEGTVDAGLFTARQSLLEQLPDSVVAQPWPHHLLLRAAGRAYDGFLGPIGPVGPEGVPSCEEDATRIIAFALCRWPLGSHLPANALEEDLVWLNTDPEPRHGEPPLPRIARLLHAWRADVRAAYPLQDLQGRLGMLGWYLLAGRAAHGLEGIPIHPDVNAWLAGSGTTETGGPALPNLLRLVHAARADLRESIDTRSPAGVKALQAWFDAAGRAECQHLMTAPESLVDASRTVPIREPLLLIGFPGSPTGRGEDARMTASALAACSLRASLLNRGDTVPLAPPIHADIVISHLNAETALEDHVWMRRMGVTARWHIGYWAWELSDFPEEWMHAFGMYDEIWAATEFARAAFAKRSPKPVRLMPMAVALPAPPPGLDRLSFRLPPDRFLFFTSFDFRSFSARKNPEAAIRAFQIAFPQGDEPVSLVVKTLNAQDDNHAARRLHEIAHLDPRILLVDRTLGREEITGLMAACDAFVSLHRSEGFGRGPAEAMLLGKPVVVTAYSGNLDFCREDNACLVGSTLVPVREGEYPGWEGQVWADPDPSVAAAHMRRLVEDPEFASALGKRAAATIRAQYDAEVVGRAYAERLQEIGASLGDATADRTTPSAASH